MDQITYEKYLKEDIRNGRPLPRCKVCGTSGSAVLDKYRIFTKTASERMVLICKNCSTKITKNMEVSK